MTSSRTSLSNPPVAISAAGRRRHSRLRVELPAKVMTLEATMPAILINLSFRGAKVALGAAQVRVGASAVLSWGEFEAFCTVAWVQGGHCGLDFEEPLLPAVLIATRDFADVTPPVDASRVAARDWAVGRVSRL